MPTSRPPRGALARRCKGGMGCGACGRGLRKPRTRAASGLRPAGHYEPPARSSLTTGIAGESAARRRDKNAAVERREASALRQGRAADAVKQAQTAQACLLAAVGAPFGAPLPSFLREGNGLKADPAPFKQYGWRSFGCLTIESYTPLPRAFGAAVLSLCTIEKTDGAAKRPGQFDHPSS